MRTKAFAAAVLSLGLVLFAFRVGRLVLPQGGPSSSAPRTMEVGQQPPPKGTDAAPKSSRPVATARDIVKTASEPKVYQPKKPAAIGASLARAVSAPDVRLSPQAPPAPLAVLEIEVEHKFAQAHLSIWVDDSLSFGHQLEGAEKKHLVVFHRVQGHEFHAMQIAPGRHTLRVQVTSDADNFDRSATVAGDFEVGTEKMLRVQFSKSGEMNLTLE